jgi:serine protease Do
MALATAVAARRSSIGSQNRLDAGCDLNLSQRSFHAWARVSALVVAVAVQAAAVQSQTLLGEASRPDLSPLISREEAVVVSIRTSGPIRGLGLGEYEENLPADDAGWASHDRDNEASPEESFGSGFVIASDGFILSNAHVVIGVDEITVRLADKRRFSARVIGFDRITDVALLKIDASNLPVALRGDPARLQLGEWVVAIGSPFGLESSVTAGIVSARRRYVPGSGGVGLIQTDVAINPGSSGSPLFNLAGEVIGMNSMMMTASGSYSGVSLAIPIDTAMRVAAELRDRGFVARSHIGVQLQEVTDELARSFGMRSAIGALVTRIQPGGPSAEADLRLGDVILGLADADDSSFADLQQRLAAWPPGRLIDLKVWRRGASFTASLVPRPVPAETMPGAPVPDEQGPRLGLTLADVNAGPTTNALLSDGLRVVAVRGAARRAGIRLGDRILAVNDMPVQTVAAFDEALARTADDRPPALLVLRRSTLNYIAVERTP